MPKDSLQISPKTTTNMPGTNIIIADSDSIIGLIHSTDSLHSKCLEIAKFLHKNNYQIVIPFSVLLETATALSRNNKINRPDLAQQFLEDQSNTITIPLFDEPIRPELAHSFKQNTSRKNTPFDHYLCALAKKNNIKYIFSFDSFYKKQGLSLAEELIKK